ncbi:MAG: ABC transporter permease, partial [Candidatus Binatia bacterium]
MTDMTANTAAVTVQPKKNRKGIPLTVIIGFIWIAAMILIALTADWIKPYNITAFDLKNRLALPG